MPPPLVSVLIPAFNAERYVADAVTSALDQTYPSVEVLVVDDGSTDGTAAALAPFEDRGVRVIRQASAGSCAARNRALREARGAFVQYLDADDFLSPDKIASQVDLLIDAPGCVAVCGTVYFRDGTPPEAGRFSAGYPALTSDDPVQWLIDLWTPDQGLGMVQTNAWLTPRAVADAAGPWDPAVAGPDDDGEYFARVLLASEGVRWTPEGKNYYRQFPGGGSLSGGQSERHLLSRLRAVDSKAHHLLPRTTPQNRRQAERALARQYADVAFSAYPRYRALVDEAERRAEALAGDPRAFYETSRLRHVERAVGWKAARRLSWGYHQARSALNRRVPHRGGP